MPLTFARHSLAIAMPFPLYLLLWLHTPLPIQCLLLLGISGLWREQGGRPKTNALP
jgi:hypothetical protein